MQANRVAKTQVVHSQLARNMNPCKSRQDHIDFDRNYCVHYAPKPGSINADYCTIGCGASARMKAARDKGGEPKMSPCIGGHNSKNVMALCSKWERRSLEHAEKRADSIEKHMREMRIADPFIYEWRTKPRPKTSRQETVECPICKGNLHLSQSSYNGHVHAHCETPDCISFME